MSAPRAYPLVGVYVFYFGTTGILLPFLPAFLRGLGLSGTQLGILLAVSPAMALLAPPLWGRLADRTGQPSRVLAALGFGSALALAPLLFLDRFWALLLTFVGYGVFASSVTTVLDSVALHRVATHGGAYAHLRLFGSLGFVASSTLFGLFVKEVNRLTIAIPLLLMCCYGAMSFFLPRGRVPIGATRPLEKLGKLPFREMGLFLVATCLHWIALAPFHGTYALYVGALGLQPWVVGVSAGLGVAAEVVVMLAYPKFADRIAPRHLLAVAFAISGVRWAAYAVVTSAGALLALSLLHGLSFGAFYVASIAFMVRRVPPERRARGQAMFVSMTFGVGGLVGYLCAGAGYDLLGGPRLFGVASGVELLAALLVLAVGSPRSRP